MKIAFFSNFINHHQVPLSDELYKLTNGNYTFVATIPLPESFAKSGYADFSDKPYLLNAFESKESYNQAMKIAAEADVVILGSAPGVFLKERLKNNKLTFRYSERWFKKFSNRFMNPYYLLRDHYRYLFKPLYLLASSAYVVRDVNSLGLYRKKAFKWGYFTKVDEDFVIDESYFMNKSRLSFMWCARFIDWKHPELPIQLAAKLKKTGFDFVIDMYGSGIELEKSIQLARKLEVDDVVYFRGNIPNQEILKQMRNHDIFLFTSDKAEGWGAVLNEAMANGCAVVVSNLIGSAPFLINDRVNGCIFESGNLESLYQKVIFLLSEPGKRLQIQKKAVETMQNVWNAKNAANNLFKLIQALQTSNKDLIPLDGPCSIAEKI